ncbi:monofunctional biosynthetic peptidoglycan transglycosylase [Chelatococcus sambhunathii]|uniref:Biosynthetic peptidoglycan transglycosylase n=1 Tax=Chelatococcus sambhunathii TaxID=363953 RepID=A0ABU1DH37_9HYPH|nr:monofunctional biosynthetic peptidoglycan transglycosylase [Chelatococcus sambhunathii]MDR4307440.1 monofunctional biosynthetic peptidoglycan transglycosylase [Chelatococcus sambhunathii]
MAAPARRSYVSGRAPSARPAVGRGAVGRRLPLLRYLLLGLLALAVAPIVLTPLYAIVPPDSTLMLARAVTFQPVNRTWTPLAAMSPALPRAVLTSEDARFCSHHGVDWAALRTVMREGGDKGPGRGASTITMQVAKNLFLWQGGAYVRKPLEIALAHWIDLVWSKRRIMEVYLNIAEWGPDGTFGAEAGARRAFGRGAGKLSAQQAALMAAALPNPILRDPRRPSARMRAHAAIVASRARAIGALADCLK